MTNLETDILVIGGGIAGCIAAIALTDTHRVVLIDKLAEPNERIGESLAPAAQRILKELNLLKGMEEIFSSDKSLYIHSMGMQSYWGSEQVHIVDHLRNPDGFGKNLNRKAFETYLRTSASKKGVTCIWPAKLHRSTYDHQKWHVVAKSDDLKTHNIKARFVIDATGRQSHFARSLGIQRTHVDKLIACWATMSDTSENTMSTISASENGWWYSAIVPNNKRVLAFQTDSDLIDRATIKDLNSFRKLTQENREINSLFEGNEDHIEYHGTVSANSTRLAQVAGQQWAALGDAAISFDPLSSQGMFNAMASAMQLKKLIHQYDVVNNQGVKEFETAYTHQIDQIWNHYLHHKKIFYQAEKRWKEAPFWKRRHLNHTPVISSRGYAKHSLLE